LGIDVGVIVVVEGPSAAGKTTWVEQNGGGSVVSEEPAEAPHDPAEAARFWATHGSRRWARAVEIERTTGLAVCDTDPLKLHYAWSMWRIGAGTAEELERQVEAYRHAVGDRRLGFADRYLVTIPDGQTLASRRAADASRRRRNFEAHARLGQPLREWYSALDDVRPGSVAWHLDVEALHAGEPRPGRYRLEDLDALLERLDIG
jgi:hypothetical protein